jgi:hypothetical protein
VCVCVCLFVCVSVIALVQGFTLLVLIGGLVWGLVCRTCLGFSLALSWL